MRMLLFHADTEADQKELDWILRYSKLELWSQLHRVLEYYQSEPMVMEKSNSFHLIKQALESLNKISKSRDIDELIDPIKARLVMALDRVDPVADIVFAPVKLEPEDRSMQMYDEQDYHEEFTVSELIHKRELEVEMIMEDEEMVLDAERGEFVKASDVIVEAIEDNDVDETVLQQDSSDRRNRRTKKEKKEKKNKDFMLIDCEHCDRKQMTKDQLKNHFYTAHVSFSGFNVQQMIYQFEIFQDGPVWCDRCGKKYTARRGLVVHMVRHEENNKTKCPHCDVMLLPESLRRHIRTRHQGYKPHPW